MNISDVPEGAEAWLLDGRHLTVVKRCAEDRVSGETTVRFDGGLRKTFTWDQEDPVAFSSAADMRAGQLKSRVEKMNALIKSFPCLDGRAGWRGDDDNHFRGCMTGMSTGERLAAEFVLYVWDRTENRFDFNAAVLKWDDGNRAALIKWLQNPWWM